ncbi:MAG: hypothetical protein GX352_00250 [Clostridiales bacterium]|nr:hypothetical protein [Clostridiales bacterium]
MKKSLLFVLAALLVLFGGATALAAETGQKDIEPIEPLIENEEAIAEDINSEDLSDERAADDSAHKTITDDKKFQTADDLFQYWHGNHIDSETSPYPPYICGVYSTDGTGKNLTFAVTKDEAGEAGKAEILGLVTDKSTVSFTYQSYSYAELMEVQLELTPYLGGEAGVNGLGIDDRKNALIVGIEEGNKKAKDFMRSSFEKYGDKIQFELNTGAVPGDSNFHEIPDKVMGGRRGLWYLFIPLALVMSMTILVTFRHRWVPLMQTNMGGVATKRTISTHQVKEMVKKVKLIPPTELDEKVFTEIKEK